MLRSFESQDERGEGLRVPVEKRERPHNWEIAKRTGMATKERLSALDYVTPLLIETILNEYQLPWIGIHGITHWAHVLENGLRLASLTGAQTRVVALFAVFHDSRRINENRDPGHGRRGAELGKILNGKAFHLSDDEFSLFETACAHHTDGLTTGDVTIQTCWDSDRLDLGRVGIIPDPKYLCTTAAKRPEFLSWAYERSCVQYEPEICKSWVTESLLKRRRL